MPKKRVGGRARRRRDAESADNLHRDASRRAQKIGYTAEGRRRLVRRIVGLSLTTIGLLVVASHLIVHLENVTWLPTSGLQDLLTGYPMGGLMLVAGMITLSR